MNLTLYWIYCSTTKITENKRSSIWQLGRPCWHRKLSPWQLTVTPGMTKLSNWRSFVFSWDYYSSLSFQWFILLERIVSRNNTMYYKWLWKICVVYWFGSVIVSRDTWDRAFYLFERVPLSFGPKYCLFQQKCENVTFRNMTIGGLRWERAAVV